MLVKNQINLLTPTFDDNNKSESNSTSIPQADNKYSFLNLQDEWSGLLKNKKTSHYVKNDPDIENKHKRPKSKKKIGLLINGNCLKPLKMKQGVVKLSNTCPVDAALHCVLIAYVDRVIYHNYIDKNDSDVFENIKSISCKGINTNV